MQSTRQRMEKRGRLKKPRLKVVKMIEKKSIPESKPSIIRVYHTLFAFIGCVGITLFLFGRLFYPTAHLFMIPDFGESDVLHLNLPLKHILSKSLKNREWPIWTPLLGNGFPLLAEGQTGTFYLPNLLLFRFLPTVPAYNLSIVWSFFMLGTGMYILTRKIGLPVLSSFYAAALCMLSGFFAVHLNHLNLLQAASLAPVLFYAQLRLLKRPSVLHISFLGFLFSQQIFAGHFYMVFITGVGQCALLLLILFTNKKKNFRQILHQMVVYSAAILVALLLSSIQLFPTYELMQASTRKGGLDFGVVTSYPYPFKHLLSFFNPYIFGNPATGTYPPMSGQWGIFWENTAYIGIVPLILAIGSVIFIKDRRVKIGWTLLVVSLLLVLGKSSPFYFIFAFPFFNLFRVPSKYLLLTTMVLCVLSAVTFEKIVSWASRFVRRDLARIIVIFIGIISLIDVFHFSFTYPPISDASKWTNIPIMAAEIKKQEWGRVASLGTNKVWNDVFLKKGWQDLNPYFYFTNGMYQNYNALFDLAGLGINTGGLRPTRFDSIQAFSASFELSPDEREATLSAILKNTFSLFGVKYVVSPYEITDPIFQKIYTANAIAPGGVKPFLLFRNTSASPRSYISTHVKQVTTLEEVFRAWSENDDSSQIPTLIEDAGLFVSDGETTRFENAEITGETNQSIRIHADVTKDGVLVLSDTYYPGWNAFVDGIHTPVYPVNLIQRGVRLSPGSHDVEYVFYSESFAIGKWITIFAHVITFLAVFLFSDSPLGTTSENNRLFFHRFRKAAD